MLLKKDKIVPSGTIGILLIGGCRMLQEITKQLQGRAEGRQVPDAKIGLCHNLGGAFSVASVTILGQRD